MQVKSYKYEHIEKDEEIIGFNEKIEAGTNHLYNDDYYRYTNLKFLIYMKVFPSVHIMWEDKMTQYVVLTSKSN